MPDPIHERIEVSGALMPHRKLVLTKTSSRLIGVGLEDKLIHVRPDDLLLAVRMLAEPAPAIRKS